MTETKAVTRRRARAMCQALWCAFFFPALLTDLVHLVNWHWLLWDGHYWVPLTQIKSRGWECSSLNRTIAGPQSFALPLLHKSSGPRLLTNPMAFCGLAIPTFSFIHIPPVVWQGLYARWFLWLPHFQNSTVLARNDTFLFSKLGARAWHSESVPSSPLSTVILFWVLSGFCWPLLAWTQESPQLIADNKKMDGLTT